MAREEQILDEIRCVEKFLKNQGKILEAWEIKKHSEESEVDVTAASNGSLLKFQITRFNGKATKEGVKGLSRLVEVAHQRIKEKEKHYGVRNTLDLILLLASYTDFPAGFRAGLKKRLANLSFDSFREIHIVCPSSNWRIK